MGRVGAYDGTVWMRHRLQGHNVGAGAVEYREAVGTGAKAVVDHFGKRLGGCIGPVGCGVVIDRGDGCQDFGVRPGDIIGREVRVGTGRVETASKSGRHIPIVSLEGEVAISRRGPTPPWCTARCTRV